MKLPPPPPGIDLSDDQRPTILAASLTTWLLAIIAIGLRLVGRRMKGVALWLDDWLIIAAVIPSAAQVFGMAGYAVSNGVGQHIWVTPPSAMRAWALGLFVAELGYFFTFMCVKWSILAFYWRSFHIRHSIRIPIYTLATIVLLWGIAVILVTLFQCQPTHAFWSRFDPVNPLTPSEYHCGINDTEFFLGNAIPTIVTDILMLLLPTPYIYTLQLRKGQKLALAGIFLVGFFVTIISVIRLNYLLKLNLDDPDITWNFVDVGLWSVLEANIAMICACLPFLRPIFNKLTFGMFNISSVGSKPHQSSNFVKVSNINNSHHNHGTHQWEDIGRNGLTSATVRAKGDDESDENPFVVGANKGTGWSVGSTKDDQASIELAPRHDSVGDGIMVTREIHMRHQSVEEGSNKC